MAEVLCSASWCKERSEEVVLRIEVQPAPSPSNAPENDVQQVDNPPAEPDMSNVPADDEGMNVLRTYFRFMYYFCISPFDDEEFTRRIVTKILHWVFVTIFCVLSLLYSAEEIKDHTIGFVEPGKIYSHVLLGFALLNGVVRLMFFYVLVFKRADLLDLFGLFAKTESVNKSYMVRAAKALPYILAFCTIAYGICCAIFNVVDFEAWSPKKLLLRRAWEVSYTASYWSREAKENTTIVIAHLRKFKNLTLSTVSLGILGISTELTSSIHRYASSSILLISAVSMYIATSNLDVPLTDKGVLNSLQKERKEKAKGKLAKKKEKLERKQKRKEDKERVQQIWKEYIHLRDLSLALERSIGTLLRWTHIYYLLFWGHFLLKYLQDENNDFDFVLDCFRIIGVVGMYYFAEKSSRKNKAFREWVSRHYKDKEFVVIDGDRIARSIVLDDIANYPIGIGSDMFYVDAAFVLKFMSVIVSYFLFIADQATKQADN